MMPASPFDVMTTAPAGATASVRDFLIELLDDALATRELLAGDFCADCRAAVTDRCATCAGDEERARAYKRIARRVEAAPGDAMAVLVFAGAVLGGAT